MIIILDTNILQEDYRLRSGRMQVLLEYAERTHSRFLLPRIVEQELEANYARELRSRLGELRRAGERVNGLLATDTVGPVSVNEAELVAEYLNLVHQRFRITDGSVIEYKPEYLSDVLGRAIGRKRPCSDNGEEIRDAVLWLSVLDAGRHWAEPVIFLSRNTNQFSLDKQSLHPDLAAEAAAANVEIHFVASLEEFARQHATPIAFITREWLESQISPDAVLDGAYDLVMEAAASIAHRRATLYEEVDGGYHFSGGGLGVDEYFVNVLSSGAYRVEITWFGHVSVAYDVVTTDDHAHFRRGAYSSHYEREVELSVSVIVQAVVQSGAVVEWSQVNVSAEFY